MVPCLLPCGVGAAPPDPGRCRGEPGLLWLHHPHPPRTWGSWWRSPEPWRAALAGSWRSSPAGPPAVSPDHRGTMPEGINHLRIGEAALLAKDLQVDWGIHDMTYLQRGTIYLEGEIVELRKKTHIPCGRYDHRFLWSAAHLCGPRAHGCGAWWPSAGPMREIWRSLICREPGMTVIGGSSDHCIVDVEDCPPGAAGRRRCAL